MSTNDQPHASADSNFDAAPIENFLEGLTAVAATLRKHNAGQAGFVIRARDYIIHLEAENKMECMAIRCTKHLTVLQQNFNEFTGGECGGCIAEERDALLARESLLTASNEDLAAQVVKLMERVEKLDRAFDAASNASEQRIKIATDMIQRGVDSERDLRELATRLAEAGDNYLSNVRVDPEMPVRWLIEENKRAATLSNALADARKAGLLKD